MNTKSRLVLFLVIALGLAGAVYFFASRYVSTETSKYVNSKWDYAFDYPKNLVPKTLGLYIPATGNEDFVAVIRPGESYALFAIRAQKAVITDLNTFIDVAISRAGESGETRTKAGERKIGGERAIEILATSEAGPPGPEGDMSFTEYYLIHKGNLFFIDHGLAPNERAQNAEDREVFESLFKSFRFTQ